MNTLRDWQTQRYIHPQKQTYTHLQKNCKNKYLKQNKSNIAKELLLKQIIYKSIKSKVNIVRREVRGELGKRRREGREKERLNYFSFKKINIILFIQKFKDLSSTLESSLVYGDTNLHSFT